MKHGAPKPRRRPQPLSGHSWLISGAERSRPTARSGCLAWRGPLLSRDVAEDCRRDVTAARVPREAASAEPSACREQTKHNPQYLF